MSYVIGPMIGEIVMEWILIVALIAPNGLTSQSVSTGFTTKTQCAIAAQTAMSSFSSPYVSVQVACIQK